MYKTKLAAAAAAATLALPLLASASSLSVSCAGSAATSSITWSSSVTGGIAPIALLWGNGSTSTSQTIATAPGTYAMTLQGTDASSSIATTTCSATVTAPVTPATTTPPTLSVGEQIAALLQQIAALKAQIAQLIVQQALGVSGMNSETASSTSSVATSTEQCFSFDRDIEEGDQGDDVRNLQMTLASDPVIFPQEFITGFFGEHTFEALKKFQEKHGIHATGFFGPMSRSFFHGQCDENGDSDHNGVPDSLEHDD